MKKELDLRTLLETEKLVGLEFESLLNETIIEFKIDPDKEFIYFLTKSNKHYFLHHYQECCEEVYVEDICGDLNDLLNVPILLAEEITQNYTDNSNPFTDIKTSYTFYKLSTIKGNITIRWYGDSKGFYSTAVYFSQYIPKKL